MKQAIHRPQPILKHDAQPVDSSTSPDRAAARLQAGEQLLITDGYGTGVRVLARLSHRLPAPPDDASYQVRQQHKRVLREASLRLLAEVVDHRLTLAESPSIGFLQELYPDLPTFTLPFIELQSLNNAWNWYKKGAHLAVLGHHIHPFYATYAPARVEHLELFATWLSQYKGQRTRAVDVGTGCGVLALMLCKAGFARVRATDISPNAIESVRREMARLASSPPIDLDVCDLLGDDTTPADVIVFNPPWTRGRVESMLDRALHFEDGLFERFFEQASSRLTANGRLVVIFSNVMRLVQPDVPHPIDAELARGRFELVQRMRRKVRPSPNKSGEPRKTKERVEVWELQRL